MALAPFFERVYGALGGHLAVSRESLSSVLDQVTVGVRYATKPHQNDIWAGEFTVNLLARLYPRIAISGPSKYAETLRELATKINPNIEFTETTTDTTTIAFGLVSGGEGILFPSAAGWVARLGNSGPLSQGPANPYSCAAAAAFASAEVFRRVFLNTASKEDVSVSLLNYDEQSGADVGIGKNHLGDTTFVGVGAVGNAALWAMSQDEGLTGRIDLIDPERLTLLNLQRYVLGKIADVGRPKVQLARDMLAATNLHIETAEQPIEALVDGAFGRPFETIAISVDNIPARRTAQALLPRLVVNGWTGGEALGASWHKFSDDAACLACLYHPRGPGLSATDQAAQALGFSKDRAAMLWVRGDGLSDDDLATAAATLGVQKEALSGWRGKPIGELYTDVVCGAVPLDIKGVGRVEVVPLAQQSALAGVLMAVELIKRTSPTLAKRGQRETLVAWDNVLQPPPKTWIRPMAREPGCICSDADYQSIYSQKWLGRRQGRRSPR